jgi:3-phosphoshikimate 1-carboxyvinyltransferase
MEITVYPSQLNGTVRAPGSKSIMQRALAAALLCKGESALHFPAYSDDCIHALQTIKQLGATTSKKGNTLFVQGGLKQPKGTIDVGESGLGIRLFTPLAALCPKPVTLTGQGSLLLRPMGEFERFFSSLDVVCATHEERLPVRVEGPLHGGEVHLDGSMSSQFLTGLLTALPAADGDSIVKVNQLKSIPYVDLTMEVLEEFGISMRHENYETFHVPGNQKFLPAELEIEGDWSAAAFLLVAGAVSGGSEFSVSGLTSRFTQADRTVTGALLFAGVKLMNNEGTFNVKSNRLKAFNFDATDCPDLFPPLAALGAFCKGTTRIKGVHRLKHKESDRGMAIQVEFAKAGIQVTFEEDEMCITGGKVQPATLHSHGDHRMAMAAAILGLGGAPIKIEGAEAVAKSYPRFFEDLASLGADLE